ncbi:MULTISPECIES: hypothetical protein [Streptomyces]|uniref:hypothetical protein n=1 Tax=Streptomyces TaxID=1883 RepID=UPI001FCC498E|nr:hypothetical protein [Streptomyces sp. 2BBP-J2]
MFDRRSDQLNAIALNTSASTDVLLRLLHEEAVGAWGAFMARPLPDEVVDAIVVHPERRLRSTLAESFAVSGEQRGRLVDDPHFRVRQVLANAPIPFRSSAPSLPLSVQRRLLDDPEPIVRRDAAFYGNCDDRLIAGLCDHEDAFMREASCGSWSLLSESERERLLHDPDDDVRQRARRVACRDDARWTGVLLESGLDDSPRQEVIQYGAMTTTLAERAAASDNAGDRCALALNTGAPLDVVRKLADDVEHSVRLAVSVRPEFTEAERAAVDVTVGPDDRLHPVEWVRTCEDADVLRDCARSSHTWLRRSAAFAEHLPDDAVELLSRDDDYAVRLLLCERQPTVDGEVVLQTYLDCKVITKSLLLAHRNFPKAGLAERFADDPDRIKRALAACDPDIAPDVLARLLTDDDSYVSSAAAVHPALPPGLLLRACDEPATATSALRNPTLPPEVMHERLDALGVPR